MADIFLTHDAKRIIKSRTIWLLGDSNMRGLYKDLVWLVQKNTLVDPSLLRNKLEKCYMKDKLIKGKDLHKGRNYTEVRCFEDSKIPTKIEFTFITECLSSEIQEKMTNLNESDTPDIIVINSCLWDITRWGPDGVNRYKQNIKELLELFQNRLPKKTLLIWTTTPPLSSEPSGGFLIKQINFLKPFLRFEVMEANSFLRQEVVRHGYDLLDIHYHLLLQIHRRRPDGIHWNPDAIRHMTNLLLTHIALSLDLPLPGNFSGPFLEKIILMNMKDINNNDEKNNSSPKTKATPSIPKAPSYNEQSKNSERNQRRRRQRRVQNKLRKLNFHNDENHVPHFGQYQQYSNTCGKMKYNQKYLHYRPY